jgi:hypothetical protein
MVKKGVKKSVPATLDSLSPTLQSSVFIAVSQFFGPWVQPRSCFGRAMRH